MDNGPHHIVVTYTPISISSADVGHSLLFAVTVAFSVYGVSYSRKNGSLPIYSVQDTQHLPVEDLDFSADTSDKLNDHENINLNNSEEYRTPFMHSNAEEQTHPSGPITWNLQQSHTASTELGIQNVETDCYGGGQHYESSQHPQSQPFLQYSANESRYDILPSTESQVGRFQPLPLQVGGRPPRHDLAMDLDHGGYAGGRVDFPEANYGR